MKKNFYKNSFYIILIIQLFIFQSCIVSFSMSGADIGEAKTISVDYFKNYAQIVHPTLSEEFTDALKEKFQNQTRLKLVRNNADLHFEGEIKAYATEAEDIKGDELASTIRLTVKINVRYQNTLDDEKDFESEFSHFVVYNANENFDDVAERLNKLIIEKIVDDVFNKAVVNW